MVHATLGTESQRASALSAASDRDRCSARARWRLARVRRRRVRDVPALRHPRARPRSFLAPVAAATGLLLQSPRLRPSCLGRRMSDVAAHLVDEALPKVPPRSGSARCRGDALHDGPRPATLRRHAPGVHRRAAAVSGEGLDGFPADDAHGSGGQFVARGRWSPRNAMPLPQRPESRSPTPTSARC
jgi:hypothetical protein